MNVLTIVAADVPEGRVNDLTAAYDALLATGLPDGLVETSLVHGEGAEWMVVTRWRDRAALLAMRAEGRPPAAVALFADLGAQPRVGVYDVVAQSSQHSRDPKLPSSPSEP